MLDFPGGGGHRFAPKFAERIWRPPKSAERRSSELPSLRAMLRVALEDWNGETMLASLESNYAGPILLAKEIGEAMERTGCGPGFVLLAMQALAVFPSSLHYAAPKAALPQAARILAQQWNHVRVNVAPGATAAGMAQPVCNPGNTTDTSRAER